ncbi:putative RNA-directed DNA polymerase [Operophtera brumata]|uniref:Putative RNA-directed DNA polymerase n=1 Tax=Operophtera brumata TaxID=104452 RepID=A0A0L7LM14_OPEBR|nr:putative RNA-directed DNA polymerase [Operophtera brumata]
MMHIFKRLRSVSDVQTIRLEYIALCQSIISYCGITWGAACNTHLIKLERAQCALLKVAYHKLYRHPTESLYKEVDHLTVKQIYTSSAIQRFHKTSLSTITPTLSNRRTVWSAPRVLTSFGKRNYNYVGPHLYTKLNKQLNIVSLTRGVCKRKVVSWLLTLNYNETERLLITPT